MWESSEECAVTFLVVLCIRLGVCLDLVSVGNVDGFVLHAKFM